MDIIIIPKQLGMNSVQFFNRLEIEHTYTIYSRKFQLPLYGCFYNSKIVPSFAHILGDLLTTNIIKGRVLFLASVNAA